jgi:hypothetical protein
MSVGSMAAEVGSIPSNLGSMAEIMGLFPGADAVFCSSSVGSLHIFDTGPRQIIVDGARSNADDPLTSDKYSLC